MWEFVPLAAGVLVGLVLGRVRPDARLGVLVVGAVSGGLAATFVSGEFRVSWAFVLLDVTAAGASALCTQALVSRLRTRRHASLS